MTDLFPRTPWEHQRTGVQEAIEKLSAGTSVCLTAPTGSGKTNMQIALAKWGINQGWNVLCITNRILLTEQTRKVFHKAKVPVGVISASMKWAENEETPIQIATIQTLLARGIYPHAQLVLIDEVHQCATGETADYLLKYRSKGTKLCGITATPLGVSNVCSELVVAARTRDLQDQGILCKAVWFAPSELDTRKLTGSRIDMSLTETEARKTWGPLRGNDEIRKKIVGNILGHYDRLHPTQTHTLAFAPGVKESLWAAQFCRSMGIQSLHVDGSEFWVDGELHDRKKDELLFKSSMERWREGEIPILWNRFVLREGIDEPQIKCVILATPVGSYRSFLQMVGRGLRSYQDKESCTVIDHGGNWWRFGSVNVNTQWEDYYYFTDPDVICKSRVAEYRDSKEFTERACPFCGMVYNEPARFLVCSHCGKSIPLRKASRPIIQSDGTLTEVSGPPIQKWPIRADATAEEIWAGLYWGAMKKGQNPTFRELIARFGYRTAVLAGSQDRPAWWKRYYPSSKLRLMPKHLKDTYLNIESVPQCRLNQETIHGD